MATDRALLTRLRVLACKTETTTGTAIALSATDALYNVMEMAYSAEIPPTEREGQGSMSKLVPIPGARTGKLTFKHEVNGLGSAGDPAWLINFIGSCGFALTAGAWNPTNAPIATSTFGGYIDGRMFSLSGAMGKVTFDAEAGKPMVGSYEFQGLHQLPTAAALLAPTYPVVAPPRFAASTLTIGGAAYRIGKVQIVIENTLVMREDGSDASATGYHGCAITNRKITIKVSPEAQALGTKDWYAAHLAMTSAAFSLAMGSSANNIITFAAPAMTLLNPPGYEDDNGIYRDSLEFSCNRSASAGDDELSITSS